MLGKIGLALLAALLPSLACADTVTIDDPLHGFDWIGGVPTNTDNGVVNPLGSAGNGFGFFASPAPQTGTLFIEILVPNNDALQAHYTLTGNLPGTSGGNLGAWTGGTLGSFINSKFPGELPGVSPPNQLSAWLSGPKGTQGVDPGATGYDVFQIALGSDTLNSLTASIMDDHESGLLAGSIITAFLVEGSRTVGTASSGGILTPQSVSPTPLPAAVWLFGPAAAAFLSFALRRRRRAA
jgi:hypothetical protein